MAKITEYAEKSTEVRERLSENSLQFKFSPNVREKRDKHDAKSYQKQ